MNCPCCRTELERGKDMRLETLSEHVCDPNNTPYLKASYYCPNSDCQAHIGDIIWNESGERYGFTEVEWIDGNDAPIPSFERKLYVEVSKHDEDYKLFTLFKWRCNIKFQYVSNENGDILNRWRKVEWVRPDNTVYIGFFRMLKFGLDRIYTNWRKLGKDPTTEWCERDIKSYIEHRFNNEELWRKICRIFAKLALTHRRIKYEC